MKKIVTIFILIALIVSSGLFITYQWYSDAVFSESIANEDITFTVKNGDNLLSIAADLETQGLIKNEQALRLYVRLNDVNANIKAGTYSIAKGTNLPNLIKILEEGTFKASVLVTIPEGLRYESIAEIIADEFNGSEEDTLFSKDNFLSIAANPAQYNFSSEVQEILNTFKPEGKSLRGFLFPDTYRFDFDATAQTVVETMIKNFGRRLEENGITNQMVNANQTNFNSIYEALTLASIIEWEGDSDDNLNLISGVFHNRLKSKFPLQADSTVNFITGKRDPGVLISDTKIDSPYNTYIYAGLPPTPISNPGIRSILAALKPESTDYFYFLHDEDGTLYFARTFEEHVSNVNRYLK